MTPEKAFFIQILADHLKRRPTLPADNLDWDVILRYSRIHQVDGITYYQCKHFLPEKEKTLLKEAYSATLYYYKNRENTVKRIKDLFRTAEIPMVIIKGFDIAACYPIPTLRTMGDVDLLVHKEDKEEAGEILTRLGFKINEKNPDYDWHCVYNGMAYELHHQLIYQETITQADQSLFFNDYWKYVNEGKLDWNFHFLFLLAHLRKHLLNKGAGFRMFMDLAVVIETNNLLNWDWITDKLQELKMMKFAKVSFGFIDRWFGIKAPIQYEEIEPEFFRDATNWIFDSGVFGYDDKGNNIHSAVNKLVKYGEGSALARGRYFIRSLFPCYNNMVNSPYYHFVRGRPWLLPAGWGYRILRLAMGKTTSVNDNIRKITTPKEIIAQREEELQKWGLKP